MIGGKPPNPHLKSYFVSQVSNILVGDSAVLHRSVVSQMKWTLLQSRKMDPIRVYVSEDQQSAWNGKCWLNVSELPKWSDGSMDKLLTPLSVNDL